MPKPPSCLCGSCPKCKHREYMRAWLRTPKGRAHNKRNHANWYAKNRAKANAYAVEHRRNTPIHKKRAQDAVAKALKRGNLVRPSKCERCAHPCKPHAHHSDYSRPLQVMWLCRSCHMLEHSTY